MSHDYASRLAEAMDSLGGDDETIIAWAEGVRSLGAEVERAEAERDALAARVKELEDRIDDAEGLAVARGVTMKLRAEANAAAIGGLRARVKELEAERDLAIAHDRQPYPTADAYEQVCAALHERTTRIALAVDALAHLGLDASAAEAALRILRGEDDTTGGTDG